MLLDEIRTAVPPEQLNEMLQRIGEQMARQFDADGQETHDLAARIKALVAFLNERGYLASWERQDPHTYLIHVANCPFEKVSEKHNEVCIADMTLLTCALGQRPERVTWAARGDSHQCTYVVHSTPGNPT